MPPGSLLIILNCKFEQDTTVSKIQSFIYYLGWYESQQKDASIALWRIKENYMYLWRLQVCIVFQCDVLTEMASGKTEKPEATENYVWGP